jgi:hypothetical protein
MSVNQINGLLSIHQRVTTMGVVVVVVVVKFPELTLECMIQSKPVADLVHGRAAQVIVGRAAAGEGRAEDGAPVEVKVVAARPDGGREVAVT